MVSRKKDGLFFQFLQICTTIYISFLLTRYIRMGNRTMSVHITIEKSYERRTVINSFTDIMDFHYQDCNVYKGLRGNETYTLYDHDLRFRLDGDSEKVCLFIQDYILSKCNKEKKGIQTFVL